MLVFDVSSSGALSRELQKKYQGIRAYAGYFADDPRVTIRFEISFEKVYAEITRPTGSYYIEPAEDGTSYRIRPM